MEQTTKYDWWIAYVAMVDMFVRRTLWIFIIVCMPGIVLGDRYSNATQALSHFATWFVLVWTCLPAITLFLFGTPTCLRLVTSRDNIPWVFTSDKGRYWRKYQQTADTVTAQADNTMIAVGSPATKQLVESLVQPGYEAAIWRENAGGSKPYMLTADTVPVRSFPEDDTYDVLYRVIELYKRMRLESDFRRKGNLWRSCYYLSKQLIGGPYYWPVTHVLRSAHVSMSMDAPKYTRQCKDPKRFRTLYPNGFRAYNFGQGRARAVRIGAQRVQERLAEAGRKLQPLLIADINPQTRSDDAETS